MKPAILLHQFEVSPFCRKVGHMLHHKGLLFDVKNYHGLKGLAAMRLSKVGKLPVLDVDGVRVQDSTCIARHLDSQYPDAPLYPTNPSLKVQAELWEDWADEVLYWFEGYFRIHDPVALKYFIALLCKGRPAWERLPMKLLLKWAGALSMTAQGIGRMRRKDVESEFKRHLDRIDIALASTGWLVGDTRTIADIAVGAQLLEFVRTSPMRSEVQGRPHLAAWLERLREWHST